MKNRKVNEFDELFNEVAQNLKSLFPKNIKLALHTEAKNLYSIGYINNPNMHAVSACVELRDNNINLRLFRPGGKNPKYKVDMVDYLNQKVSRVVPKSQFDHYIYTDIPQNIMARNNISIKCIVDENKKLVPKRNSDGSFEAFINFDSPKDIIKKKYHINAG